MTQFLQEWWPALTAVILPFVVAAIAKCGWSGAMKGWLAFGLSAIVGLWAVLQSGIPFNAENLSAIILAVYGGVQLAYRLFSAAGITSAWLDWLLQVGSPVDAEESVG